MESSLNGYGATTQFAVVSYIPDPLGSFLSQLRTELIPACRLQSHLTVLPPRSLSSPVAALVEELRQRVRDLPAFEVELGEVEIFPVTNVIYISLKNGTERIERLHESLGRDLFTYREPFPFHPHVTLAQEIPLDFVPDLYARACQRWHEWAQGRSFYVDNLVFVRNRNLRGWETLSEHALRSSPILRTA